MTPAQDWQQEFDRDKFAATVLYFLRECAPRRPGLTNLLKLVWYADYKHYCENLRPITGAQYVALPNGPVIDDYRDLFSWLESEGYVSKEEVEIQGHEEKKQEYRPEVEPDEDLFSSSEAGTLRDIVAQYGQLTGSSLSEKTHREGPWSIVWNDDDPGREIPYLLFRWLDTLPDSEDQEQVTRQLERQAVQEEIAALQ